MNLKDDFEEIYNSLYSLVSELAEVSSQIVRGIIRFLIILTSPFWFLPYLIIQDVIIPSLREDEDYFKDSDNKCSSETGESSCVAWKPGGFCPECEWDLRGGENDGCKD